jgi:hypothetical protein
MGLYEPILCKKLQSSEVSLLEWGEGKKAWDWLSIPWNLLLRSVAAYTDKKVNQIFLIYKEIQSGAICKVIYEEGLPNI